MFRTARPAPIRKVGAELLARRCGHKSVGSNFQIFGGEAGVGTVDDDKTQATRPERRIPGKLYSRTATEITGKLQPTATTVSYTTVLSRRQHWLMISLGGIHILLAVILVGFLLLPGDFPRLAPKEYLVNTMTLIGVFVMILMQVIVALRTWVLTYFAAGARDPVPMVWQRGLRVAILTTIV